MSKTYNIPIKYKEGIYSVSSFENYNGDMLRLDYDDNYKILTYEVPGYEYGSKVTLYSIPQDKIESTLKAVYNSDGHLKKITMDNGSKDMLLYIYYENAETAMQEIKDFAIRNSNTIIEKTCMCQDLVSRLFIEYFNDGEYIDFHAKIGTNEQKITIANKYPDNKNAIDNSGNYPISGIIGGDNDTLKIMVLCADNDEMDFFQFAVDIMSGRIGEKAIEKLNKTDDFKFICDEYD